MKKREELACELEIVRSTLAYTVAILRQSREIALSWHDAPERTAAPETPPDFAVSAGARRSPVDHKS